MIKLIFPPEFKMKRATLKEGNKYFFGAGTGALFPEDGGPIAYNPDLFSPSLHYYIKSEVNKNEDKIQQRNLNNRS